MRLDISLNVDTRLLELEYPNERAIVADRHHGWDNDSGNQTATIMANVRPTGAVTANAATAVTVAANTATTDTASVYASMVNRPQ